MLVQPITNNQPQFSGKVDRSVTRYIHRAIRNEYKSIQKNAKNNNELVPEDTLFNLYALGAKIINGLCAYMKRAHKNTTLTLGNTSHKSFPRIINPFSGHIVRCYNAGNNFVDDAGELGMNGIEPLSPKKTAGLKDLKSLENFLKNLSEITPKDIDKAFLNSEKERLDFYTQTEHPNFAERIKKGYLSEKINCFEQKLNEKIC